MNQRGKNNSIIFLTTLSVYLGLVLVGGSTPQVLAQKTKKSGEPNKISILVPGEGLVFTFDLNPAIELSKLSVKESLPIKISGKLINPQQKFIDWTINEAVGNQQIVSFLCKEFFLPSKSDVASDTLVTKLFPKEVFQSVEVSKDTISITLNLTFNSVDRVAEMAEIYRRMIEYAKSPKAKTEVAGNLYLINTEVRSENNQVIIVTRLPRGSLDELLKQNAKAENQ